LKFLYPERRIPPEKHINGYKDTGSDTRLILRRIKPVLSEKTGIHYDFQIKEFSGETLMSILNSFQNIEPERLRKEVEKHLQWCYAHNHLSIEELEKRLDALNRTEDKTEILALVKDLPPGETGGDPEGQSSEQTYDDAGTEKHDSFFSLLGSNSRKGKWDVPASLEAIAILGSQDLDFREARFSAGVTRIHAVAILGSVDMKFPPGVRVSTKGIPILGSIDNKVRSGSTGPLVEIDGVAFFGSISARSKKR